MRARRVVFTGRGQVAFEGVEVGKPADDQILVETLYTAISPGTERAFLLAEPNTITHTKGFPFRPGYSNVGRVIEVGAAIRSFRVGQLIATKQPHVSHFLMPEITGPGYPPEKYREQFRSPIAPNAPFAPLHYIWPLRDGLDEQAQKASAPFGIVSVGITGARYARIDLGESVLVLGLGPVGLYAALSAKLGGGVPVLGIDPVASRRKTAQELGLDGVYAMPEELGAGQPLMAGTAPQVVIEATGRPEVIPLAFRLCGRNGRVVLLGSTRGTTKEVDFYTDVHRKGITVIGAQVLTRPIYESSDGRWTAWDEDALALRLIAGGRLDCRPLIAREFPVDQAPDVYRLIQDSPATLGVLLNWTA
jgi:threonine dehydrogenase-like Zn-dependent dehydrogenase